MLLAGCRGQGQTKGWLAAWVVGLALVSLSGPGAIAQTDLPAPVEATPTPEATESAATTESDQVLEQAIESLLDLPELPTLPLDLRDILLLPDPVTATWLDDYFNEQVAIVNRRIGDRQTRLYELLADPEVSDDRIRNAQNQLSRLRADRDRMAIEHLLLMRQVQENLVLPALERTPNPNAAGS